MEKGGQLGGMGPEALRLVLSAGSHFASPPGPLLCVKDRTWLGPHMWLSKHTSDGVGSGLVFAVRCSRLYKASTFALVLLPEKSIVGAFTEGERG